MIAEDKMTECVAAAKSGVARGPSGTSNDNGKPEVNHDEKYVIMQSDATQAYCQAELGGSPTWIRLLQHRRPDNWGNFRDPVCRLVKALYGHPNSGCFWEQRCEDKVLREGFRRIGDCGEWRSC